MKTLRCDAFAVVWLISSALLCFWIFHSQEQQDVSARFFPSWNAYLKSVDTTPQMLAYKSFLVLVSLGCGLAAIRTFKHSGSQSFISALASKVTLAFCTGILAWTIVVGGLAGMVALGCVVSVVILDKYVARPAVRWAQLMACCLFCLFFVTTGIGDYVYSGFWNSSYFSWHYGSYFSDTIKQLTPFSLSALDNNYGIFFQTLIAEYQRLFGPWDTLAYVKFVQLFQSLILICVLLWLLKQYLATPSWIILFVGMWFALVYNGGTEVVTNATQSLVRRSALIFYLISLYWFMAYEKRQSAMALILHGLFVAGATFVSVEIGVSLMIASLGFWALSAKGADIKMWLLKCAIFLCSCMLTVMLLGFSVGQRLGYQEGVPIDVLLAPFRTTIFHLSFGGAPLLISPLLISMAFMAAYFLISSSKGWFREPVTDANRIIAVTSSLTLLYLVYYLQRNHLSTLATAVIPAAFGAVFFAKSLQSLSPPPKISFMIVATFMTALAASYAREVPNAILWRYYFTKDYHFRRDDGSKIVAQDVAAKARSVEFANITDPYILVSPYYFQIVTTLEPQHSGNLQKQLGDLFYRWVSPDQNNELLRSIEKLRPKFILVDVSPLKSPPPGDDTQFKNSHAYEIVSILRNSIPQSAGKPRIDVDGFLVLEPSWPEGVTTPQLSPSDVMDRL
jgi:hypothetical protein